MDLLPWMERWHMLPPEGGVILCAVSGGRDSVCLLHYLTTIAPRRGFTVAAAHLNHRMRPEAQRDEDFVRGLCREWNVPFYTEAVPVYKTAARWGLGVEETGRRLRYDFLLRTADAIGAAYIATAHHAQDQAETVLLNLLRGTGPEGLGGIPPVRGRIIRPLLQTGRAEIEDYLRANGLPHVEDSTNQDTHYARNRLRRELWPQLETVNPAVTRAIGRTAEIVRGENAYLDTLAAERLPAEGTAVETAALLAAPEPLRPRMVRLLLDRLPTGKKDVSAVHMDAVLALAALAVKPLRYRFLQGLTLPVMDQVKNNGILTAAKSVPGVGNLVGGAAQTLVGSTMLIKSAIGVGGVIGFVCVVFYPLLKMGIFTCFYKVAQALVQPVSSGGFCVAVAAAGECGKLLFQCLFYSTILFSLAILILLLATNLL